MKSSKQGQIAIGVDIGTTTVSMVAYDISNKKQIEAYSVPHNSYVKSDTHMKCLNAFLEIIQKNAELATRPSMKL